VLGFLSYGLSLSLFILALRHLATARTAAYFSTAPFTGALIAVPLLQERRRGPHKKIGKPTAGDLATYQGTT
jgi:drug/metabolite transporter (DMT)-like permease